MQYPNAEEKSATDTKAVGELLTRQALEALSGIQSLLLSKEMEMLQELLPEAISWMTQGSDSGRPWGEGIKRK